MNVSLTPELDQFVQKVVAGGRYASASEVVRSGLRLLADQEADREARQETLRAWIQEAIDDPRPKLSEEDVVSRVEARLAAKLASIG